MDELQEPNESPEPKWLDDDEQVAWRSFLRGSAMILERIGQDMSADSGLSFNEYEVLVRLSEAPDRRLRMSSLAENLVHSRSRLTHTVSRLEAQGYVQRVRCPQDRRGIVCILTDKGFQKLEDSAPAHVRSVQEYIVSRFTKEEFLQFGKLWDKLLSAVED